MNDFILKQGRVFLAIALGLGLVTLGMLLAAAAYPVFGADSPTFSHRYTAQGTTQDPQTAVAKAGAAGVSWDYQDISYSFQNFAAELEQQQVQAVFQEAFAQWSDAAPMEFREVSDTNQVDIRISFTPIDGPGDALAETKVWTSNKKIQRVEIQLDNSEIWATSNQTEDLPIKELFIVATHEIGHALGLEHVANNDAVMGEYYDPSLDTLTQWDIDEVQAIYPDVPDED